MAKRNNAYSTSRDVCRVLFRHRRKMLVFFLGTLGLVVLGLCFYPRSYRSEGRLFVRLGKESVGLDPTATVNQTMPLDSSRETEINSELEILRSRVLLEDVVKKLGAETILHGAGEPKPGFFSSLTSGLFGALSSLTEPAGITDEERAVNKLEKSIATSSPRKSNIIIVKCRARDPHQAQLLLNAFLDTYLVRHMEANRTSGSHQFFVDQSGLLEKQLADANEELRAAKNSKGLLTFEGQRDNLQSQINSLEAVRLENQRARATTAAKIAALEKSLADTPATELAEEVKGLPNVAGDSMRNELYKLQIQEREATSRNTEDHPLVKALRRQVAETQQILEEQEPRRSQTTNKLNPIAQRLRSDLIDAQALAASEQAEADSLDVQYAAAQKSLHSLNDGEEHIRDLVRRTELLEASYRSYATNREQARIDQALERDRISNVNIVQPATYVAKPYSPKILLTLGLGLFVAGLGSVVLAFATEYFDRSIKTPDELERELGVPVLTSIPRGYERQFLRN